MGMCGIACIKMFIETLPVRKIVLIENFLGRKFIVCIINFDVWVT